MNDLLITFMPEFKRDYKRLAKKYLLLDEDIKQLIEELQEKAMFGTSLGNNAFKI
jgi:mRNA-degrading endonuclease YafQ of YafQ-DinJ toxin-antitoxin module